MTLSGIHDYPTSPPTSFELAPAGTMVVASIDDTLRTMAGHSRVACNDLGDGWWRYGNGTTAATYTYVDANNYKVAGVDATDHYLVNRRTRAVGTSTGDILGSITAVSYSAPDTTVTVSWDSGTLQSETLAIYLGPDVRSLPVATSSSNGVTTTANVPTATTTQSGVLEIATVSEANAGVAPDKIIVPSLLSAAIAARAPVGSTATVGIVQLASTAQAAAGSSSTLAVTPAGLTVAVPALVPPASTGTAGKVALATNAQAQAGSSTTLAVTPSNLESAIAALVAPGSTAALGVVQLATAIEVAAGTNAVKPMCPGQFTNDKTLAASGHFTFPSGFQICWGTASTNASGVGTIIFEEPFNTACVGVFANCQSVTGRSCNAHTWNTAGCSVYAWLTSTLADFQTTSIVYVAVGY